MLVKYYSSGRFFIQLMPSRYSIFVSTLRFTLFLKLQSPLQLIATLLIQGGLSESISAFSTLLKEFKKKTKHKGYLAEVYVCAILYFTRFNFY